LLSATYAPISSVCKGSTNGGARKHNARVIPVVLSSFAMIYALCRAKKQFSHVPYEPNTNSAFFPCLQPYLVHTLWHDMAPAPITDYHYYFSLSPPTEPPSTASSKKKYLTDSELALRREETARKRKNLSEKKLEDEKVRLDLDVCSDSDLLLLLLLLSISCFHIYPPSRARVYIAFSIHFFLCLTK